MLILKKLNFVQRTSLKKIEFRQHIRRKTIRQHVEAYLFDRLVALYSCRDLFTRVWENIILHDLDDVLFIRFDLSIIVSCCAIILIDINGHPCLFLVVEVVYRDQLRIAWII